VDDANTPQTNPRWRTAAILKNLKLAIFSNGVFDFDEIWHNDASQLGPLDPSANKIYRFLQYNMANGHHFENEKSPFT